MQQKPAARCAQEAAAGSHVGLFIKANPFERHKMWTVLGWMKVEQVGAAAIQHLHCQVGWAQQSYCVARSHERQVPSLCAAQESQTTDLQRSLTEWHSRCAAHGHRDCACCAVQEARGHPAGSLSPCTEAMLPLMHTQPHTL